MGILLADTVTLLLLPVKTAGALNLNGSIFPQLGPTVIFILSFTMRASLSMVSAL
jgi:hypothetical protein